MAYLGRLYPEGCSLSPSPDPFVIQNAHLHPCYELVMGSTKRNQILHNFSCPRIGPFETFLRPDFGVKTVLEQTKLFCNICGI
jgi:hypothetical protein